MIKIKQNKKGMSKNMALTLMVLPGIIYHFIFSYMSKIGVVTAFQDYNYRDGLFGSPLVGLKNFEYVFSSGDILVSVRNTIGYTLGLNIALDGMAIIIAMLLYAVGRKASNTYQKFMTLPFMTSYNVLALIVFVFLAYDGGIVNTLLNASGKESVAWYLTPSVWPAILIGAYTYFGAGVRSLYYYSVLMGIDTSLMEAVDIDGGRWYHKVRYIMWPELIPILCLFAITSLGNVLGSNLELHLLVPMESSALYSTTDVLATYQYRGLQMGDIGTTSALGFVVGCVNILTVHIANSIVKKISPGNSLY